MAVDQSKPISTTVIAISPEQGRALSSGLHRLKEIRDELHDRAGRLDAEPSPENKASAAAYRDAAAKISAVMWIILPHFGR